MPLHRCLTQLDVERKQIATAAGLIIIHRLPPYMLSKDQTSAPDKLKSLLWPFLVENRCNLNMMKKVVLCFQSLCCDFGVEHVVPRLRKFDLREMFPWCDDMKNDCAEPRQEPNPEDEFEDMPALVDIVEPDAHVVSLEHLLPAVGLVHEIHNLSNDLPKAMKGYRKCVGQMKHIAKMVREPESRRHLKATCFGSADLVVSS